MKKKRKGREWKNDGERKKKRRKKAYVKNDQGGGGKKRSGFKKKKWEGKDFPKKRKPLTRQIPVDEAMCKSQIKRIGKIQSRMKHVPHLDVMRECNKLLQTFNTLSSKTQLTNPTPEAEAIFEKKKVQIQNDLVRLLVKDGNVLHFSKSSSGVHLVHSFIKFASPEHRLRLFKACQGHLGELIENQKARHVIEGFFSYLHGQRRAIVSELRMDLLNFLKKKYTAIIASNLYDKCTIGLKNLFYSGIFLGVEQIEKARKKFFEKTKKCQRRIVSMKEFFEFLPSQITEQTVPIVKGLVIRNVIMSINKMIEKGNVVGSELACRVLVDFFENGDIPKNIVNLMDDFAEYVPHCVHLQFGAKFAVYLLAYSSPAQRKVVIKALSPFAKQLACNKYGFLVLCFMMRVIDDTVRMKELIHEKILTSEKEEGESKPRLMCQLLLDEMYFRRMILYLLTPASIRKKYGFNPDLMAYIAPTNLRKDISDVENHYGGKLSKKPEEKIIKENLQFYLPFLAQAFAEKYEEGNGLMLILKNDGHHIVTEALSCLLRCGESSLAHLVIDSSFARSSDNDLKYGYSRVFYQIIARAEFPIFEKMVVEKLFLGENDQNVQYFIGDHNLCYVIAAFLKREEYSSMVF